MMKLIFEPEDIERIMAREAAELLLGSPSQSDSIDINYIIGAYSYGSGAVASIKDDEPEQEELQPIVNTGSG